MNDEPDQAAEGAETGVIRLWEDDNGWNSVSILPDKWLRICSGGTCCQMPLKNWVRLASEGIDESKHIDAMFSAIDWCLGPSHRLKVRERYRELVMKPAATTG